MSVPAAMGPGGGDGPSNGGRSLEIPDDFRRLDFDRLWKGRDRTTAVESALVAHGLGPGRVARVLELGAGDGRLTPVVRERAEEYIGLDQSFEFLQRLRRRLPAGFRGMLVEANLYHLPFVEGAVSASLLARVYNFLVRPERAVAEIGRVLTPGGRLLLTCNVRPSVGSLVDDVRVALARRRGESMRSATFSRAPVLPVAPSTFPAVAPTRSHLRATLAASGLVRAATLGSGLEDFRGIRALSPGVFLGAGVSLGRAPVFPLDWELLRRPEEGGRGPLPRLGQILACPRCRRPFGHLELGEDFSADCGSCGFRLRHEAGIVRARFDPGN